MTDLRDTSTEADDPFNPESDAEWRFAHRVTEHRPVVRIHGFLPGDLDVLAARTEAVENFSPPTVDIHRQVVSW